MMGDINVRWQVSSADVTCHCRRDTEEVSSAKDNQTSRIGG